ncbi:MAG: alpha/beta hydrolase [Terriglobia bacterium]
MRPAQIQTAPTRLVCSTLASKILARRVNYCIDLPADYASGRRRYPVLYFLHGLFEDYRAWGENGGKAVLDAALQEGRIGAFLVVLPDAGRRSFYVNAYNGRERYEDFLLQELVPAIDQQYRTIPRPGARGISGVSMGGYGSLHLAMRHANVFGSVSAQGAALVSSLPDPLPDGGRWAFYQRVLSEAFGDPVNAAYWEANNPLTLAQHPEQFPDLKIYFDCGTQDRYGFEHGAEDLDHILNEHDFPHIFALRSGGHGWSYLHNYLHYALEFHWSCFQAYGRSAKSPATALWLRSRDPRAAQLSQFRPSH